ncbi:hypothetical protein [Micromonospora sp. NPDC049102]|uniref:hypothetical protein n=1 Tax=Micromonospora sp. NPDC049102 TaxID=3364265 RepID=UPI00372287C3
MIDELAQARGAVAASAAAPVWALAEHDLVAALDAAVTARRAGATPTCAVRR